MLNSLVLERSYFLIVGDFHVHILMGTSNAEAKMLRDCLTAYNLVQNVNFPTHRQGLTLDLLVTRSTETAVSNVGPDDLGISDHRAILCELQL